MDGSPYGLVCNTGTDLPATVVMCRLRSVGEVFGFRRREQVFLLFVSVFRKVTDRCPLI